jgi:Tol biopolymer transport system component
MPKQISFFLVAFRFVVSPLGMAEGNDNDKLQLMDIFRLEYASDPQISPDGEGIVYVRNFMDVMKDKRRSNLWLIESDGSENRPLTSGNRNDSTPRWSPDGRKLLYASSEDGTVQLYLRWMDTGQTAKLTQLPRSPAGLSWSPDGRWIAFSMLVPERPKPIAKLPLKPKGAEWAPPPKIIEGVRYRADGAGYLENGYTQLFVLSADGGTPRQLTSGRYHHRAQADWTPDSRKLLFSANRNEDWEYSPLNTEVYELEAVSGELKGLTRRVGPDRNPKVSPDGATIAYLGFDDHLQGYQVTRLYLMDADGSNSRLISSELDRSISDAAWRSDGQGLFIQFDDRGNTRIAFIDLKGSIQNLVSDVGGMSLGRPYSSGTFSASANGRLAYTLSRPDFPADVAVWEEGQSQEKRLTDLNADLWSFRNTGEVEEIWYKSSYDGRADVGCRRCH